MIRDLVKTTKQGTPRTDGEKGTRKVTLWLLHQVPYRDHKSKNDQSMVEFVNFKMIIYHTISIN